MGRGGGGGGERTMSHLRTVCLAGMMRLRVEPNRSTF